MRLKAKNSFNIPLEDALIVFVNKQNDRFPCMISKNWTVNRCKTVLLEQVGLKSQDTAAWILYLENSDGNLSKLTLDDQVGKCLNNMQDLHLLNTE